MNVKSAASEGSEGSEEHSRESLYCHKEYLNHHKQTIDRNMNVTGVAGEDFFIFLFKNLIYFLLKYS